MKTPHRSNRPPLAGKRILVTHAKAFMAPLQSQWQLGHSVARRQLVVATAA